MEPVKKKKEGKVLIQRWHIAALSLFLWAA